MTSGDRVLIASASSHTDLPPAEDVPFEVVFEDRAGHFRETTNDQVMEKVDDQGHVIGFSILKVSAAQSAPLEVALSS